MQNGKYGGLILDQTAGSNTNLKTSSGISVVLEGRKDWSGIQHRMKWTFLSQPVLMVDKPHSHDFDEILCFLSSNPANELEFGAKIELSLGQEEEKQIISSPSIICIPKGLVHCPLHFVELSKTILFVHIYISPEYIRKPVF
jgi:hypothetical protein